MNYVGYFLSFSTVCLPSGHNELSTEHRGRPSSGRSIFQNTSAPTSVWDKVRTSERLDGVVLAAGYWPLPGEVRLIEMPSDFF